MEKDKLLAVTVLYRHGDRAPFLFYPNDPHKDSPVWTDEPGELTNSSTKMIPCSWPRTKIYPKIFRPRTKIIPRSSGPGQKPIHLNSQVGKVQMYEVGKWLRKRYDGFLSTHYTKNEIYVRSSNEDRCLMSAAAALAGLFPPVGKDIWNPSIPWQPIPIHQAPGKYDDTIYLFDWPKYLNLFSEVSKPIDEKNVEFYEYLTRHTGIEIQDLKLIMALYDVLKVEERLNLILPKWTHTVYPKLKELRDMYYSSHTATFQITRMMVGRFFHQLLEQFSTYADGVKDDMPKMRMYSGHDVNVEVVLSSLKIEHSVDIPLAATLIFELRRSESGSVYVQLVYKKNDTVDLMPIKNSFKKCDYEEFKSILSPMVLSEEEFWSQ